MAALTVYYRDAERVTGRATAAIIGARLVKVSGTRADGENIDVATAGAGEVVFGVAGASADSGATVPVIREGIVGLMAAEDITAGQRVSVAADGKVQVWAGASGTVVVTGNAETAALTLTNAEDVVGVAVADIASGAHGPVALSL